MYNEITIDIHELDPTESLGARELVLGILNEEYRLELTLDELPDLVDIHRTYRDSGAGNFWVVSEGGKVVGCIGVLQLALDHYELRRMYVHPAHRGRGIAQHLLETVFEWATRRGVAHLWLETNEAWHAAHHIYEKHGFESVPRDRLPPEFPVVRVATGFYHRAMTLGGPALAAPTFNRTL